MTRARASLRPLKASHGQEPLRSHVYGSSDPKKVQHGPTESPFFARESI